MVKYAIAALVMAAAAAQGACGGELLLLDFSSPYCGPCQQMIPTIERLEAAGYPVRRVDTTREPAVAQQFNVTQIPCFIMTADGREIERLVGATSQERLLQMFQSARAAQPAKAQPQMRPPSPETPPTTDPWSGVAPGDVRLQSQDPPRPASAAEFNAKLISSSVRLRVDDPQGHSYGTGTIIDARSGEALVITCGHLFRDSSGKGAVMVELFTATAEGVRVVEQVPGHIIDYNLDRDVGLVSIRPRGPVQVAPIAPTDTVVDRGDRVTSVGCDHGKDPTALPTRVTNVDRYQGPPNIEAGGAPVEGRSGGGLFNSDGHLVGVCFAADYEGNEGLYTALESIHSELDRLGLRDVYGAALKSPANRTMASQPAAATATATPPVVRGQEPLDPVMPIAEDHATAPETVAVLTPANSAAATPAGLNPVEQAAWEEIMARAAEAEVICIVRPREPGGKSEVITLDRVSPAFVHALAERSQAPAATATLTR